MVGMRKLYVQELSDSNVSEPRKLLERQEEFAAPEQKPEPMLRNVGYFNLRNALSKLRRSHLCVPGSAECLFELTVSQSIVSSQFYLWFHPEIGLSGGAVNMDVHSKLFA